MAARSSDVRDEAAERPQPAPPRETVANETPAVPPGDAEAEAEKARTEIEAGEVADDLADFA